MRLFQLTCGSAFKNKGVQAVLDGVVEFLPSPEQVKQIQGILEDGTEEERPADDKAPFAALAFKIATDPFVGTLTFFRVYSGTVKQGDAYINPVKSKRERSWPYRTDAFKLIVKRSKKSTQATSRRLLVLKTLQQVRHCVLRIQLLRLSVWNSQNQLF